MKFMTMLPFLATLLFLGSCTFSGEITPNIECTNACDAEEEECITTCKKACVDAGGEDPDAVCDEDCDTTCSESYDECTVTCTGVE